jgi:hypothetical protein
MVMVVVSSEEEPARIVAAHGQVIGVTIINARRLLDRDGHLMITLPHEVHVDASDLAGALS